MQFDKLLCPKCGKHLLDIGKNAIGVIRPYCKSCKAPVVIVLGGGSDVRR